VYKACQNSWLYIPFGGLWCIYKGVVCYLTIKKLQNENEPIISVYLF
jgi:hypothetical protein